MAMYGKSETFQKGPKKRTSQGDGLRKRGSFKKGSGSKKYRGQGDFTSHLANSPLVVGLSASFVLDHFV